MIIYTFWKQKGIDRIATPMMLFARVITCPVDSEDIIMYGQLGFGVFYVVLCGGIYYIDYEY